MLTVDVLQRFPDAREKWSKAFRYVLVDEYQDTNHAQYVLLKLLAGEHRNLMAVGDPDQCLVAGTLVTMADRTTKPIEEIEVGDEVLSCYGSGEFRAATVTRTHRSVRSEGFEIVTVGGRRIVSTPEHVHFAGAVLRDESLNEVELSLCDGPNAVHRFKVPDSVDLRSADLRELARAVAIAQRLERREIRRTARFGKGGIGLPFSAASSVRPRMVMFTGQGDFDVVERVERVLLDDPVYDIDVARTHNFVA